jgi:lipopolysaccharide biosynthesis glycosyltransferase
MKENLLVTLADVNFLEQAKQLFSSVYWNAGWDGNYMLLAHEIPASDLDWFKRRGILIKEIQPLDNRFIGDSNYSPVVLDKFHLFTEEFKKWKHVVFLDADIIVKASLKRFVKTDTFKSTKIVFRNFRCYFSEKESKKIEELKIEFNLKRSAFNSGVISFNTDIIKPNTFDNLNVLCNKYFEIINGDDSVFNLYFYDIWEKAPLVFNARVNHFPCKKLNAIVLHFEKPFRKTKANDKPWLKGNPYFNEWTENLLKAEYIELEKPQKVKELSSLKIKCHSILLSVYMFPKYFLSFILYLVSIPQRIGGNLGKIIKKYNPELYNKLRFSKDGK